ncbi:MAG: RNA polymerase sigma factor [Planctomycetota bacterium]|mgnify:CR=1 FL=1
MTPDTTPNSIPDSDLLCAWHAARDEAAFHAVCARHTGLVLATCRRLGAPDADEATQAVFLVLAQKAGCVKSASLTCWLIGTARRVVANQRQAVTNRRRYEREASVEIAHQRNQPAEPLWEEASRHLDEALASLSVARREAVMRFYLQGQPQAEVAAELGCSIDAVKTRVHEGLAQLLAFFKRRGVALSAAALASGLATEAAAASPALATACTQAATLPTSSSGAAGLAKSVLHAMAMKTVAMVAVAGALLGVGAVVGFAVHQSGDAATAQRNTITYAATNAANSITFTLDATYTCGQYANGDWWVMANPTTHSVVLQQISPAYTIGRHGWAVNPSSDPQKTTGKTQWIDDRYQTSFDPSGIPTLPYVAHAGDSIVKTVSARDKSKGQTCTAFAAVLTVVDTPPSPTAFRPPYMGAFKPTFDTSQLRMQLLPTLAPVAHSITQREAESRTATFRLDDSSDMFAVAMPNEAAPTWGCDMARSDAEVFLWLCLDASISSKRKTIIGMVQYGIDLYGALKGQNATWDLGGCGNGMGRLLPLVFTATLLDSQDMRDALRNARPDAFAQRPSFEEIFSFSRGRQNQVLWGQPYAWSTEERYWYTLAVDAQAEVVMPDPYGFIDGGSNPGAAHQGITAAPALYAALVLRLFPALQTAWPDRELRLLTYADRWATQGVWTLPDPVAPAPHLTEQQWAERTKHGYGTTWGPDPAHPGTAIHGSGRFPTRHGTHAFSSDLNAVRTSAFAEAMWHAYRGTIPESPNK